MKTPNFVITFPAFVLAAAISTDLSHAQTAASSAWALGASGQFSPGLAQPAHTLPKPVNPLAQQKTLHAGIRSSAFNPEKLS